MSISRFGVGDTGYERQKVRLLCTGKKTEICEVMNTLNRNQALTDRQIDVILLAHPRTHGQVKKRFS